MPPEATKPIGAWANYLIAAVFAGVGLLFSLNVLWHAPGKTFVVLLIAVVLTTYLAGFGPGVLATALCALGSIYFLLPPVHSLHVAMRSHLLMLGGFMTAATVLAFMVELTLSPRSD